MNLQDLLEVRSRILAGLEPDAVTIRNGKAELHYPKAKQRLPIPAPPIQMPEPLTKPEIALIWDGPVPDVIREPEPLNRFAEYRHWQWEDLPNRRASPWHRGDVHEYNLCADLSAFPFASASFEFTATLVDAESTEDRIRLTFQAIDPVCIRSREFSETLAFNDAGIERLAELLYGIAGCVDCRPDFDDIANVPFRATMKQ